MMWFSSVKNLDNIRVAPGPAGSYIQDPILYFIYPGALMEHFLEGSAPLRGLDR